MSKKTFLIITSTILFVILYQMTGVSLARLEKGENNPETVSPDGYVYSNFWLLGWKYRKFHVVKGGSTESETNYQIRIKIHYGNGTDNGENVYLNGYCRTDFGDVRFTKNDGISLLSYYIIEKVDSQYAIFWIKVPYIPPAPDFTTIFVYYGKEDATDVSNGQDTFVWFDHFDTDKSSEYRDFDLLVNTQKSCAYFDNTISHYQWADIILGVNIQNFSIEVRFKQSILGRVAIGYRYINANNLWLFSHNNINLGPEWCKIVSGRWTVINDIDQVVYTNEWYLLKVNVFNTSHKVSWEGKNASITWSTKDDDLNTDGDIAIEINHYKKLGVTWIDYIIVCKYSEPEPIHGAWGSEESLFTTPHIEVDRIFVSVEKAYVGSVQTIGFHAKWGHNDSDVIGGNIWVNGTRYTTNGSGWFNFHFKSSSVGKKTWTITAIDVNGVKIYSQTTKNPSIMFFDRIKAEYQFETLIPGKIQVIINLKSDFNKLSIEDALVKVNNVIAENLGSGVYKVTLFSWMPYLPIKFEVERNYFDSITEENVIFPLGNIVFESSSVTMLSIIVFLFNARRVRRRKWQIILSKLEGLLEEKERVELKEVSEDTGVSLSNIKALFSDLMREKPYLQGFFINDDKEFILESALVYLLNSIGRVSFEDLGSKLGVTPENAREIIDKLYENGKIKGYYTLDGKGFVTEEKLREELIRGVREREE